MQILDYVIIGCAITGLIVGAVKGMLKQIFTLGGVVIVAIGTAYLFPYPQQWLSGVITNADACAIVAMIITFVVLALIYGLVTNLILKIVNKFEVLKTADKILGLAIGVAVVYFIFAVIVALLTQTSDTFMPWTKSWMGGQLEDSVIVGAVYKNNWFGDWLIKIIGEKLPFLLPQ